MRCSDVTDVIGASRRHVGGILNVNKHRVKMRGNLTIIMPRLFVDRAILLLKIPHTTAGKHA